MRVPRPQIPPRLRALVRSPGGLAAAAGPCIAAVACAFAPLADHFGFEFAAVLTLVSAVTAAAGGAAAARLERARERDFAPGRAAIAAMGLAAAALVPAALVIAANALRHPACGGSAGALWLFALPLPTALLAAALGTLARLRARTTRGSAAIIIAIEGGSLVLGLSTLYTGPAFYLYDYFFGYLPGPLYDEVVEITPTLGAFRFLTLVWAAAAWLGCTASGRSPRTRTAGVCAAALSVGALAIGLLWGTRIGLRTTDASLAESLGGLRREGSLEIRHPREWPEKTVLQFARDAAYRASQVRRDLGVPDEPVRIWVYRSADEKRRLVGASSTSFSKPWRREIHVHASGVPHPVLRHELVHAYASALAPWPFRVPGGVFPNSPLVEGLAVSLDTEPEGLTLAQRARAMRDLGLAPDLKALLSPAAFLTSAAARAYGYAGAFLQYLGRTRGRDAVLKVYATGRLSELAPPEQLVAEFDRALGAVEVNADERAAAQRRYARASVFHRRCAREVAALSDRVHDLASAGDREGAIAAAEQACGMEPDDPALLRGLMSAALQAGDGARARAAAERVLAHPKADPELRAQTLTDMGDAAWKGGREDEAHGWYGRAATLPADEATRRAATARLAALSDPGRAAVLRPLLAEASADLAQLFRMSDRLETAPDDALVAYLLGRQLVQRDAPEKGVSLLLRAKGRLADAALEKENLRLAVRALSVLGRCDDARRERDALREAGGREADDANAADWVERCRFHAVRGWGQ